jgi:hypothetical protein
MTTAEQNYEFDCEIMLGKSTLKEYLTPQQKKATESSLAWYRAQNWFCKLLARAFKLREVYENGFAKGWESSETESLDDLKAALDELKMEEKAEHFLDVLSMN